jgi:hypothetical protein
MSPSKTKKGSLGLLAAMLRVLLLLLLLLLLPTVMMKQLRSNVAVI